MSGKDRVVVGRSVVRPIQNRAASPISVVANRSTNRKDLHTLMEYNPLSPGGAFLALSTHYKDISWVCAQHGREFEAALFDECFGRLKSLARRIYEIDDAAREEGATAAKE